MPTQTPIRRQKPRRVEASADVIDAAGGAEIGIKVTNRDLFLLLVTEIFFFLLFSPRKNEDFFFPLTKQKLKSFADIGKTDLVKMTNNKTKEYKWK